MALFTTFKQTLTSGIASFASIFNPRNLRHHRLPSDPPSPSNQALSEAPFQQQNSSDTAANMPPVGSTAPITCKNPEQKFLILRILQGVCMFGWISCIGIACANTGRWSYSSIQASVIFGSIGTAATALLFIIYMVFFNDNFRPSNHRSHAQLVLLLLTRISLDACTAVLWLLAVVAGLLPKRNEYRGFLTSPPYATWVGSVAFAALECCLFVSSSFMLLVIYRMGPSQRHDQGIELNTRTNIGNTANRGAVMPTTGLARTG